MNRRKSLTVAAAILGISGIALFAWPFLASLSPAARAGQSLPHLDISELKPGEYAFFDGGSSGHWRQNHFLVIRQTDGTLNVLLIESDRDGQFLMPDINWWGISGLCTQLSLSPPRGKLPQNGDIRCLDPYPYDSQRTGWRWDYKGKNISKSFADFLSPGFVFEDEEVIIGKWR